jgi:hypothetical protein
MQKGQKCVQQDVAIAMWELLFSGQRTWPLLEEWCDFLHKHHNRAISKDTWTQLLDFIKVGGPLIHREFKLSAGQSAMHALQHWRLLGFFLQAQLGSVHRPGAFVFLFCLCRASSLT